MFEADGTGRAGMAVGVLFGIEFACIFVGLQFTSASRMVVFLYLSPFVVALGMPFIARSERLSAGQMAGLVLAFAGVAWAFAEGFAAPAIGPRQWIGDSLGVAGAVFWGLTTLVIRATSLSTSPPEKTLLYQLGVSAVVLGLLAQAAGERLAWPSLPLTWLALGFQTVIVTFASYLVWFWLVRHYPATRLAAFTLLTPLFGLLAGVLLLDEPLTVRLAAALVAVCVGIGVVNLAGRARSG
jgi:drug/metabolite transporter (DMT)-like permease